MRDLGKDLEDEALVEAIIGMAQSLKLKTIAEGVETMEQLEYLRAHGCNEVQGYYYSRPLPAKELEAWMTARHEI